jgi:dUTP pyrophosphatase
MEGKIGDPNIVRFKRLNKDTVLPKQAHSGDAGFDLHACCDQIFLNPGDIRLIPCGFSMELPSWAEAQIRPRSGLALKHGVTVLNAPGTVDAGYRGPVGVILANFGQQMYTVKHGDRIAQMVVKPVLQNVRFEVVGELSESERGEGGFGSSGT